MTDKQIRAKFLRLLKKSNFTTLELESINV